MSEDDNTTAVELLVRLGVSVDSLGFDSPPPSQELLEDTK